MSWSVSLRNDFTLRPFEEQLTRDGAAMASGPPDVTTNQEPPEVQDECSGKKKSKFQTFKKFFTRKKRKDAGAAEVGLKASQSSDDVSKTPVNNTLTRSEKGSGSKISLSSKALSHDSVFVSDSEGNEALGTSQDSIHGKVKSLQLQLKQAIRLGSPPSLMCVKRTDDGGTMSEDDGLPCSPPEYTTLHTAMSQAQRHSSISMEGIDSDDDQRPRAGSSRPVSPLVVPGDFSQPASPFGCLDNSAAKHKLGLRHKACNKRKPVTRLEVRSEMDSATVEQVLTFKQEEEAVSERIEVVSSDQLKPNVETYEEQEEEMNPLQGSGSSSFRDELEEEKVEDESDGQQDVSQGSDTSCPAEQRLPEEKENPDVRPLPSSSSSQPSSTASSPHTPSATPEPPAGHREVFSTPTREACGEEERQTNRDFTTGEEEEDYEDQEIKEEENSFLQEVLSSLQTPISTRSQDLKMNSVALEEKEGEQMDKIDIGDGEDVKEDNTEEEETPPQAASLSFVSSDELPEGEEECVSASREEEEEDEMDKESEQMEDTEEEPLTQVHEEQEEDNQVDFKSDGEIGTHTKQVEKVEEEEEEEEEEERWEKTEEHHDMDVEERMEKIGHDEDEAQEMFPEDEEVHSARPLQSVNKGDDSIWTKSPHDEDFPTELSCHHPSTQEEDEYFHQEDEKEKPHLVTQKSSQKDEEAAQCAADESREHVEQDGATISTNADMKSIETDASKAENEPLASPNLCPFPIHESHIEISSLERRPSSPSKTSTVQISLASPSSEQAQPFSRLSLTDTDPQETVVESPTDEAEFGEPTTAEDEADTEEEEEEEKYAAPPAATDEVLIPLSCGADQRKARFTIAPAWQRSQSPSPPPSSPPLCVSSPSAVFKAPVEVDAAASRRTSDFKHDPTDAPKAEPVCSPSRARSAGSITGKPQSLVKPQPLGAASTEAESSVIVEGNPDNPFGVRLRKTSGLIRLSSEEENVEQPLVSPTQPATFKADTPQPMGVKPAMSQLNTSKPAIPKKPEVTGDGAGKLKRISDPAAGRGLSAPPESPSWISVAKQKQRIYKENSLEEITVKKETREEQEGKSSLYHSIKPVSPLESSKPSPFVEKDPKLSLSPPTPVPPQPVKPQSPPCSIAPKPQVPPATAKPPTQPHLPQRSLSPPTPVPVSPKATLCSSPPPLSETVVTSQMLNVTSPPFSTRTATEKSTPGQTASSQRGLNQDEPPWMALAKKKAKAWSEMPQIVQ
ncbi:uncharacterized protein KIAA1211 isoform X3 [Gouania willdenowi]|uniref:uncharacterized protein KIAA1211 isoform X3 n=1 Tax=Gouania willdenowi TaxID=441366 RepID=UPI00105695C6|nr:uncharacterized protein KIAA1211-like isoform X3 [Gouania willdenowi]